MKKTAGNGRIPGGGMTRFRNPPVTEPSERALNALSKNHPAMIEGRTLFPSRVFNHDQRDRLFISGMNNAKIGSVVRVGEWRDRKIFTFSLEERATCPRSCAQFDTCYGNSMHLAVRFRYSAELMVRMGKELRELGAIHRRGFVIRLHVLGDIPDIGYLMAWRGWMRLIPNLYVWGYTAHPRTSEIGELVEKTNSEFRGRWLFRFSVPTDTEIAPYQAVTTWTKPDNLTETEGGTICPAETGKTHACGTCGLCWNPENKDVRIVFMGHGTNQSGIGNPNHAGPGVGKPSNFMQRIRPADREKLLAAKRALATAQRSVIIAHLSAKETWTKADFEFRKAIDENAFAMARIEDALNGSESTRPVKLQRPYRRRSETWPEERINCLKTMYPSSSLNEILAELNNIEGNALSEAQVIAEVRKLRLRRSHDYLSRKLAPNLAKAHAVRFSHLRVSQASDFMAPEENDAR